MNEHDNPVVSIPVLEHENGSNDLSQRVKTMLNTGLTKSIDSLVLDARSHMQSLIEEFEERQLRVIDETTDELAALRELMEKNRQDLHQKLEQFAARQHQRLKLVGETLEDQTSLSQGLNEVFSKLNNKMQET